VRTVRKASGLSLGVTTVLFFFINVAYVAAVPAEEIRNSGQLVAVLFFRRVFGESFGTKVFPLLVALSCFGNIVSVQRTRNSATAGSPGYCRLDRRGESNGNRYCTAQG
jgi:amino acid transporter